MKDSFNSMADLNTAGYVVNIRGSYANLAAKWLMKQSENIEVSMCESPNGWFYDTSIILKKIKTDYILIWIEDQICLSPIGVNNVVIEMKATDSDILTYTYWALGKYLDRYISIHKNDSQNLTWFDHNLTANEMIKNQKNKIKSYIIGYPSIIKFSLFNKLIEDNGKSGPYSNMTPFNFEKEPDKLEWLPIRRAIPKYELFAPIDDDHGYPGTCLQARGLYPVRCKRHSYAIDKTPKLIRIFVKLNEKFRKVFLFIFCLLSTPFFYKYCYIKSLIFKQSSKVKNSFNFKTCEYLEENIYKFNNILELGSTKNINYWDNKNKKLTVIDFNDIYYKHTKYKYKNLQEINITKPNILYENFYNNKELCDKYKFSNYHGYEFSDYFNLIELLPQKYYDLIVLDSSTIELIKLENTFKILCSKVKGNGVIILNNIEKLNLQNNYKHIFSINGLEVFESSTAGFYNLSYTMLINRF